MIGRGTLPAFPAAFSVLSRRRALALLAVLVPILVLAACSRDKGHAPPKPSGSSALPVTTVPVEKGSLPAYRTIPGRITFDPSYYKRVMARVSAISTVELRKFPGDTVRKGEVVAILKSPEFLTAETEVVSVIKDRGPRGASAGSLLSMAEEKLRYLGASRAEIDRLVSTRTPTARYEVHSPIDGTIVKTGEIEGSQVHSGDILFEVSDLHHLWVKAFIYPGEEGHVRKGSRVFIQTIHRPLRRVSAVVDQVFPMVDRKTRTIPIRISLPNPDLSFEPDLWVSVLVPESAGPTGSYYLVPTQSIFENERGTSSVIVTGNGSDYRIVAVEVAGIDGEKSMVRGDFRSGDRVVTDGLERLRARLLKKISH
jgi:Cu(I)/Ag(I) efflux system membrane fusion protein